MTILITGSSGFIGSNLIKNLQKKKNYFIQLIKLEIHILKLKIFQNWTYVMNKELEKFLKKKKLIILFI